MFKKMLWKMLGIDEIFNILTLDIVELKNKVEELSDMSEKLDDLEDEITMLESMSEKLDDLESVVNHMELYDPDEMLDTVKSYIENNMEISIDWF